MSDKVYEIPAGLGFIQHLIFPSLFGEILTRHKRKEFGHTSFKNAQRFTPQDNKLHKICRVALLVKGYKFISDIDSLGLRLRFKDVIASNGELMVRVPWIGKAFFKLVQTPLVALKVLLIIQVHRAEFSIDRV